MRINAVYGWEVGQSIIEPSVCFPSIQHHYGYLMIIFFLLQNCIVYLVILISLNAFFRASNQGNFFSWVNVLFFLIS